MFRAGSAVSMFGSTVSQLSSTSVYYVSKAAEVATETTYVHISVVCVHLFNLDSRKVVADKVKEQDIHTTLSTSVNSLASKVCLIGPTDLFTIVGRHQVQSGEVAAVVSDTGAKGWSFLSAAVQSTSSTVSSYW